MGAGSKLVTILGAAILIHSGLLAFQRNTLIIIVNINYHNISQFTSILIAWN